MKNTISVSVLIPVCGLIFAGAVPALAATPITGPAMALTDGTSSVLITVDATGTTPTVTFSSACNNCSTSSVSAIAGQISWSGTLGTFTVSSAVGRTKPLLLAPAIDVGLGEVDAVNAGKLTVAWTDQGFSGVNSTTASELTSFFQNSPNAPYNQSQSSASYKFYIDNSDTAFGTASTTFPGLFTVTSGTLSSQILNATANSVSPVVGAGITANPLALIVEETVTMGANSSVSNDVSFAATAGSIVVTPPPAPAITIAKSVVGATTVNPFTRVTYKYVVTNTGNTTLTGVTVVDDNATPTYAADDFTPAGCLNVTLAPAASVTCTASVYPPVTEGANDVVNDGWGGWGNQQSYDYKNIHAGGQIICQEQPNGNIKFTYLVDPGTVDNTYGQSSASDWGWWGSRFGNLLGATAEFGVIDGQGNKCLDFTVDYLSPNWSYKSGYGTNGCVGLNKGSNAYIGDIDTSASHCLNQSKVFENQCRQDSPAQNVNWENQASYTVEVSSGAWGSRGFGGISCPKASATAKNQNCDQHVVKPCNSTATNTAVVAGVSSGKTVTAKAKATVTILATPQTWSKAGCF